MSFNFNAPSYLSPEDTEIMDTLQKATAKVIKIYVETVDYAILERLEIICNRMPSDDEIYQHAHCGIHPDGRREYKWKGETFLIVPPIAKCFFNPEAY